MQEINKKIDDMTALICPELKMLKINEEIKNQNQQLIENLNYIPFDILEIPFTNSKVIQKNIFEREFQQEQEIKKNQRKNKQQQTKNDNLIEVQISEQLYKKSQDFKCQKSAKNIRIKSYKNAQEITNGKFTLQNLNDAYNSQYSSLAYSTRADDELIEVYRKNKISEVESELSQQEQQQQFSDNLQKKDNFKINDQKQKYEIFNKEGKKSNILQKICKEQYQNQKIHQYLLDNLTKIGVQNKLNVSNKNQKSNLNLPLQQQHDIQNLIKYNSLSDSDLSGFNFPLENKELIKNFNNLSAEDFLKMIKNCQFKINKRFFEKNYDQKEKLETDDIIKRNKNLNKQAYHRKNNSIPHHSELQQVSKTIPIQPLNASQQVQMQQLQQQYQQQNSHTHRVRNQNNTISGTPRQQHQFGQIQQQQQQRKQSSQNQSKNNSKKILQQNQNELNLNFINGSKGHIPQNISQIQPQQQFSTSYGDNKQFSYQNQAYFDNLHNFNSNNNDLSKINQNFQQEMNNQRQKMHYQNLKKNQIQNQKQRTNSINQARKNTATSNGIYSEFQSRKNSYFNMATNQVLSKTNSNNISNTIDLKSYQVTSKYPMSGRRSSAQKQRSNTNTGPIRHQSIGGDANLQFKQFQNSNQFQNNHQQQYSTIQPNSYRKSNSNNLKNNKNLDDYHFSQNKRNINMNQLNSSNNYNGMSYLDHTATSSPLKRAQQQAFLQPPSVYNQMPHQLQEQTRAQQLLDESKEYFKQNNLEKAIQTLQLVINDESNNSLEGNYLLGVCYLGNNALEKAVEQFNIVTNQNPLYRKNIYILSSIAYKKLDQIQNSLQMLDLAIQNYQNYYDAYIYRGKLHQKEKAYEKALSDFTEAINIQSDKALPFLHKADCYKFVVQYQKALEFYNQALKLDPNLKEQILAKKIQCNLELNNYGQEVLQDVKTLLEIDSQSSEACYYKGIILKKQKNPHEALLSFEQSIKHNNSRKSVAKSLLEIGTIYIEQRDFYAALHTLNRSEYMDIDKQVIENMRIFTEGVIFLMKRKFEEAMENFQILDKKQINLGQFLQPLFHQYRAYGHFCQGNHKSALFDYLAINEDQLDKVSAQNCFYNRHLCEGILAIDTNQFEEALELFQKSHKILKQKIEPLFYRAVTMMRMAFDVYKDDEDKKREAIMSGLQQLDKAIETSPTNANLFYYRALVRCMLGYFKEGVEDVDMAIEKSEDNVPKYFYLRGHIFGSCQSYKQAVNDLGICLQIDENFAQAYLERCKDHHYLGDSNQAFADLQKYISLKPNDPEIHTMAGNLLFHCGALDDAIKAYSHSDQQESDLNLLAARSKCYIALKELDKAYVDIEKVVQQCSSRSCAYDFQTMQALKLSIDQKEFKESTDIIEKIQQSQIRSGRTFKEMDIVCYKAVFKFYNQKYESSVEDFAQAQYLKEQAINELKLIKRQQQEENENETEQQEQLSDTDIEFDEKMPYYDFSDSYNINQCLLNMAICFIMQKEYTAALLNLNKIVFPLTDSDEKESKFQNNLEKLIQLVGLEQQIEEKQISDYKINSINKNEEFIIFEGDNFWDSFPSINLNLKCAPDLALKLSFGLPKVEAPPIHPEYDIELVSQFQVTDVENKPEAPWIRRNQEGVIFTDNIQVFESLDLQTEERENTKQSEKQQLIKELEIRDQDINIEEEKKNARQNLQLDLDIEAKLNKLMQKKQQQKKQNEKN
ncbi:hypothetical protein PPERSA_04447 [Pseudocohnilembus persalinus]|uniref:Uncharacterized protein n=1 Tax=Pseudocohnilembus persalinus TaxID=266149 RepID=A0A0V0QRJ0_PSEPJ|nr:hypothetical protein PPERSA_04447 [Pseudocohnilembus persalinus]|eukprot:KRX04632.1 hypothetical protein PPERSA_04447 [Pseudocohnilembus persalinus]